MGPQDKQTLGKIFCSGCRRYFAGVQYHEMHRTGNYRTQKTPNQRRCMTGEEMRNAGLDCELRNVRIIIEGKPTIEQHMVWYHVAARENMITTFKGEHRDVHGDVDE